MRNDGQTRSMDEEKETGRTCPEQSGSQSSPPATFIVVRHGQTVWNSQGRWQGWEDSPLTELGRQQAQSAAKQLRGAVIDVAYSSDSGRAMDTARIILDGFPGVELHPAPELRERSYGAYEGLNTEEIDARFPNSRFDPERDTREEWRAPGENAETLVEVRARLQPFLAQLAQRHAGQSVLIVTHSNVVRIVDGLSCGQTLDEIWDRAPHNACVFILQAEANGALRVVRHFCGD